MRLVGFIKKKFVTMHDHMNVEINYGYAAPFTGVFSYYVRKDAMVLGRQWAPSCSFVSTKHALEKCYGQDWPETCARPGQASNLAPLQSDIL